MAKLQQSYLVLIVSVVSLTACQKYHRKPLNLEAHREAWAGRDLGDPQLAAFAAHLAGSSVADEFNPADGLSLPEAEIAALFFNPELRTARLRARVMAANAQNSGLWDDPVFDVNVLRIIESVPDPWIIGTSLGFTIPISGRLEAAKSSAKAEHRAELARVAQREWEIVIALRATWIEWSAAKLRADVSRQLVDRLGAIVSVTGRLEQAGEIPRIESRLFEIETVDRNNDMQGWRARALELELVIKEFLGFMPEAPIELHPAVALELMEVNREQGNQWIAQFNPALAVSRAEYEMAEQALHREIRKQYPDLVLGPAYANEDGQSRIGLIGSLPIPILNRNRRGIAEAEAAREASRAAFESKYESLVHGVAQAEAALAGRREIRMELESRLVPLVEDQYRDAQRLMELGELNTLVQLESLTRLQDAKLKLIDARQAEAQAANRVRSFFGPMTHTPESLEVIDP